MVDQRRRYAIVGTGSRARMYVGALTDTHADVGELVALCDPNPLRMDYYRDGYGLAEVPTYAPEDLARLFDETRPDALIVTSPDATHDIYVTAALERGLDVITEKPMTIDDTRLRRIVDAVHASPGDLTVTFNYRYSPRNSVVRQLIAEGAIGDVTSVHFEWLLDTAHGADYFRRWHRLKDVSGGLLVHKSTHHFDLVNWWLADVPTRVYASGGLKFYGKANADARGLGARTPLSRDNDPGDPFRLDLAADPLLKGLYLDAESADGYQRDLDVFNDSITIEDSLNLIVDYARGATMSYSLSAFGPWEGYRVAFNGTEGRIELDVVERGHLRSAGEKKGSVVDPSAVHDAAGTDEVRPLGERVLLQRHWETAQEIEIPVREGGHGGGDAMLLDDLFRGAADDPLGRAAGYLDGIRSVIVGVAGNKSLAERRAVETAEFGLPLNEAAAAGVVGTDATEPVLSGGSRS
ncbi:MAG TPA: Gfo/Idh/MocA family oxidoreductase [Microlunatus sp.]|nr:Gfo/Idh/MocA family oxidoreductase [Microlunatus sp.]